MGLFDDAGIDAEELAVSGKAPIGTFDAEITNSEQVLSKKGDPYIVFTYVIKEHEWPIQDWFRILPEGRKIPDLDNELVYQPARGRMPAQTEKEFFTNAYKQLKRRLMDFGVAPERVNSVDPSEFIGHHVQLTLGDNPNNNFPKITKVTTPGASGTTLPKAQPSPITSVTTHTTPSPTSPTAVYEGASDNPFAKKA